MGKVELDVKLAIIIHVHHTGLPIRISVINCSMNLLSQLGVSKYCSSLQLLPLLLCYVTFKQGFGAWRCVKKIR